MDAGTSSPSRMTHVSRELWRYIAVDRTGRCPAGLRVCDGEAAGAGAELGQTGAIAGPETVRGRRADRRIHHLAAVLHVVEPDDVPELVDREVAAREARAEAGPQAHEVRVEDDLARHVRVVRA